MCDRLGAGSVRAFDVGRGEGMDAARECDLVVVGAGISGLTVAAVARSHGLDVVVLEARDRVGGRLLSEEHQGGWLDLGATWFWAGETAVESMLRELGLSSFRQWTAGDAIYDTDAECVRLQGNPIDVPALRYRGGAQALAQALAARLPQDALRLATAVRAIEPAADGVEISTAGGARFRGRRAVLALPPALAVSSIELPGSLLDASTRQVAAATAVWMGAVAKVVLVYGEPFWRAEGLAGAAVSTRGPLTEIHDMSGPDGRPPALFGFAPVGLGTASGAEARLTERALAQLERIFGPRAGKPQHVRVVDWSADRWTTPARVDPRASTATYGHRVYDPSAHAVLLWASTETSPHHPGHVEGAIAAGVRAAAAARAGLSSSGRRGI